MMKRLVVLLLVFVGIANANDWHAKWEQAGTTWFERWSNTLNSINTFQNSENIEILGSAVRIGNSAEKAEQIEIFRRAQSALLAIPGHAEYYGNKILTSQERVRELLDGVSMSEYLNEQMVGFQTLKELPSAECVRVAGAMLSNDWVPPGNDKAPAGEKLPLLGVRASGVLVNLPIIAKPVASPGGMVSAEYLEENLPAWCQWYEGIKSGKRTFRFEGDPTEYDLNGPVPKEKLDRIARDRKRDAEREAGHTKTAESPVVADLATTSALSRSTPIAILIAGMVLLVSLGWYLLKARSRRDP